MSTSGGGFGVTSKRTSRAIPAFNGNNIIHSNPLPPVSNLPSFSYGSPQTTLPKPINIRDTRVAMNDALEQANAEAQARLEAVAQERKAAEERAAAAAAPDAAKQTHRQTSVEPAAAAATNKTPKKANSTLSDQSTMTTRRRGLRSQSVLSRTDASDGEDNFNDGDETSLEIFRIIENAKNPEPAMLRNRSINIGVKEPLASETLKHPRSAMKGSREEANRPSAKTRAKRTPGRRTAATILPVNGEKDATFDEENQGIGLASRLTSSHVSPSPTPHFPDTVYMDDPDVGNEDHDQSIFRNSRGTPPDTIDYSEPSISRRNDFGRIRQHSADSTSTSPPFISKLSHPLGIIRRGAQSAVLGVKKTATILAIFFQNLFGPLFNYLLLGFFIFGVTTLSYSFLHGSSNYTPPFFPPSTADGVSQRLMRAEKQLGKLSHAYEKGAERWDSLSQRERDSQQSIEQQLSSMKSMISAYSSLSAVLAEHTSVYKTDQRAVTTMQARVERMDQSIKNNDVKIKEYAADSKDAKNRLDALQKEINGVNHELEKFGKAQQLLEITLETIESRLPKEIAARLDPDTGEIVVAPELLRYLQAAMRKDIEDEVGKIRPIGSGRSSEADIGAVYNWDDFLKKNAAELRGFVGKMSQKEWSDAIAEGVVVSRETMIDAIREEFTSVRGITEHNNKELMKSLMSQMEVAAQDAVTSAATSISSAALAVASNYVRGHKGARHYGDALIQAALHHYSATALKKPDYALLARGTLIDPRLTSSTFDPYANPGLLGSLSGFLRPGPNEPAHVITESMNVGDCWSFPQSSGQVSMLLAEEIFPTHVTVDHVPRGISGDDSSAPRQVEFWIRIDDDSVRDKVSEEAKTATGPVADSPSGRILSGNGYVRVASFVYDLKDQLPTQTFDVQVDLKAFKAPIRGVSFRILSNWGNEEYTSIYRLRVHGDPARLSSADDE